MLRWIPFLVLNHQIYKNKYENVSSYFFTIFFFCLLLNVVQIMHLIGFQHEEFIIAYYNECSTWISFGLTCQMWKLSCKVPLIWRFTIILLGLLRLFRTFQKDREVTVFIPLHLPWYIQDEFVIKSEFCTFHTNWCMQVTLCNTDVCALPPQVSRLYSDFSLSSASCFVTLFVSNPHINE
jgi:hypothetical protein